MSKSSIAAPRQIDPRISLSTVYRTLNLFEEAGLVTKHDFKDGRARFELIPDEHHDHLIDIRSGKVIEFRNEEIEAIQEVDRQAPGLPAGRSPARTLRRAAGKRGEQEMIFRALFFIFVYRAVPDRGRAAAVRDRRG